MIVIIGDISNSRKLKNRDVIQDKLNRCLDEVNEKFKSSIVAKFSITLGDEFQGVLNRVNDLFNIIHYIESTMEDVNILYSVGIGEIYTKINQNTPLGTDGPAWWGARDSLNLLKEKQKRGVSGKSNIYLSGKIPVETIDVINNSLVLCYRIKQQWTKNQREIFNYIFKNTGLNDKIIQTELASTFNIAESDVNRKIKTSGFMDYVRMFKSIEKLLNSYGEVIYA